MDCNLPPVDNSIASSVDSSFADADTRLRGAYRNRKARKRIRQEDFDAVQTGRVNSTSATQSGLQSHQQVQSDAGGATEHLSLASRLMGSNLTEGGQAPADILQVAQSFLLPPLPQSPLGDVPQNGDVSSLTDLLARSQQDGLGLRAGLQNVGQQHAGQMVQNTKIGGLVQKFSSMEQKFAGKEAAFMKKFDQFNRLAAKFDQVATSLVTASAAITGAATSIDAAAAACAAIPFVGPVIAAALRVAASALRVVARALQMVGKQMQVLSKTMKANGVVQKVSAQMTKVQKVQAQVKKVANQASQKLGLKRLQELVNQRKQLQNAVGLNLGDQQKIKKRLQELQGKGAESALGSRFEPMARAQAEMQLQQRCIEVEALRFMRQDPTRLLEKQQALCQFLDQLADRKVAIGPAVAAKVRKALTDSPFQPQRQLQLIPEDDKGRR